MNRIILIGNGFDLAHGLKNSYADFILWCCENRIQKSLSSDSGEVVNKTFCETILGRNKQLILARIGFHR